MKLVKCSSALAYHKYISNIPKLKLYGRTNQNKTKRLLVNLPNPTVLVLLVTILVTILVTGW